MVMDGNDLWYDDGSSDLWCDDGSSYENSDGRLNKASDMEREWERRHNQFHTIGYRDGLIAGKEAAAQEGFNIGFKEAILKGYNLGVVRGIVSAMTCLPERLKEKLVETEETRNEFLKLHDDVQSLSTMDALKLLYQEQKRISENQKESSNQASDTSVLKNYDRQLQSLLGKSPMLEKVVFK